MKGFIEFIKKQGVIGLAIGFILGAAVTNVVTSLIIDIVNPVLGIILGLTKGLETAVLKIGPIKILYGHFISVLINFFVIASVVYGLIKIFKLDSVDKKK